jgi:hypothetical protein
MAGPLMETAAKKIWPNHALQRTAQSRYCWQSNIAGSPSLSLGP